MGVFTKSGMRHVEGVGFLQWMVRGDSFDPLILLRPKEGQRTSWDLEKEHCRGWVGQCIDTCGPAGVPWWLKVEARKSVAQEVVTWPLRGQILGSAGHEKDQVTLYEYIPENILWKRLMAFELVLQG